MDYFKCVHESGCINRNGECGFYNDCHYHGDECENYQSRYCRDCIHRNECDGWTDIDEDY